MKQLLTIAAVFFCLAGYAQQNSNTLSAKEKKEGWKLLFDGSSTKGWHTFNTKITGEAWKVSEGNLYLNVDSKTGRGDLSTDKTYSNFDLKLEWKISKNGNSGIIFYSQEGEQYKNSYLTGPEMQVLDNDGHPDGKIIKHRAGDLYDLIKSNKETAKPVGEWNEVEIISNNGNLSLFLNGEKTVSTILWDDNWKQLVAGSKFKDMPDFGKFKSGKIVLQDHGDAVYFRNIKIKAL